MWWLLSDVAVAKCSVLWFWFRDPTDDNPAVVVGVLGEFFPWSAWSPWKEKGENEFVNPSVWMAHW